MTDAHCAAPPDVGLLERRCYWFVSNTAVPDFLEKSDLFRKHSKAEKDFEMNKGKGGTVLKQPNLTTFLGNRKKIYIEKNSLVSQ